MAQQNQPNQNVNQPKEGQQNFDQKNAQHKQGQSGMTTDSSRSTDSIRSRVDQDSQNKRSQTDMDEENDY